MKDALNMSEMHLNTNALAQPHIEKLINCNFRIISKNYLDFKDF